MMKDIHIKVNLTVFAIALFAWVFIGGLITITMYEPKFEVPEPLMNLFATLTGVVLTTLTGFTKSTIPTEEPKIPTETLKGE